jgi:uncharacterized membrane protein
MSDSSASTPVEAGQTAERVAFFTDAVFAIAMTLLVIEIPRPAGSLFDVGDGVSKTEAVKRLWHFLVEQDSSFVAYLLAFFILWVVWREHHALMDKVGGLSGPMIGLHFPLLLLVAFLPYTTTIIGHYPDNPLAAAVYTLGVGGVLLSRTLIQWRAYKDDVLLPDVDRAEFRTELTVSVTATAYWFATLAVAWWTPWVLIPWFATSTVASVARRFMARGRPTAAHDGAAE